MTGACTNQMEVNLSLLQRLGSIPPLNMGPSASTSDVIAMDQDYDMSPPPQFATRPYLVTELDASERPPKHRKTGTSASRSPIIHYGIPGSVTWFMRLDNAATPLTFPYHIAHMGHTRRQVSLFFSSPAQAGLFVNAWNRHCALIVNNAAFNVALQPASE
ncbi:hypothetical protein BDP27DRAFT_1416608 [Rhodocollybia butyracea]|uniref:Uncharacterized protein n=1 Tax=Rhodocollybia butyracea TaxID=206335 RepID=A0A9P5Q470_9AGAR|nr:hypothetical protein BDP27DRAFT_1416608 [Rhodocollybia butyracea]